MSLLLLRRNMVNRLGLVFLLGGVMSRHSLWL
jgi:hypothetical protein